MATKKKRSPPPPTKAPTAANVPEAVASEVAAVPAPVPAPSLLAQIEFAQANAMQLRDEWMKRAHTPEHPGPEPMRWAYAAVKRFEHLEEFKRTHLQEAELIAFTNGKLDALRARRQELADVVSQPLVPLKTPVEP